MVMSVSVCVCNGQSGFISKSLMGGMGPLYLTVTEVAIN